MNIFLTTLLQISHSWEYGIGLKFDLITIFILHMLNALLALLFVVRQLAVPPVGLSAWRSFVFRCSISIIFMPDFNVIHTSFECTWYLYIIVVYAIINSLPYHCSIRFLFSLRAGDRWVGAFFVSGGTVSCHYGDLWCRWWQRGCGLDDLLFSVLD